MSTSEAMWWLAQLQVWVVQKSCFENKCCEDNIRICYEYSQALKYAVYDALNYMESMKPNPNTVHLIKEYTSIEYYESIYNKYCVLREELKNQIADYNEKLYKDFLILYEQWTQILLVEYRRYYLIYKECIDICDPKRE